MFFSNYFRYFILILGWVCLASIHSNMIALNMTLICMSEPVKSSQNDSARLANDESQQSPNPNAPTFAYTSTEKAWLMWTVGIGAMLGTFPFSWLCSQYGAKFVMFYSGLLSSVATVFIPLAAIHFNFTVFLLLRFLQGVAYSADFAAVGMICNRWSSLKQYAVFISVLTCFMPLSISITNPVSGMICESRFGWPMVYYGHAGVCFLLMILWLIFYSDHPSESRFVTPVELEKIHRGKTEEHIKMYRHIPYRAILTDKVIWIIWLNAFVDIFAGTYTWMYIPSYFKYILNFGVTQVGFFSALSTFMNMPTRISFGYFSDKFRCISERTKLLIYNTVSVGLPGFLFLIIGFFPSDKSPVYVLILFTCLFMFLSLSSGGFYKCGALYSRNVNKNSAAVENLVKKSMI